MLPLPKHERSKNPRKKTFNTHLLTSPDNQEKIRKANEISRKKEEKAVEKQGLIKKLVADDRSKKVRKKSHAGQILYKQGVCQQDVGVVGGMEGVGEVGLV